MDKESHTMRTLNHILKCAAIASVTMLLAYLAGIESQLHGVGLVAFIASLVSVPMGRKPVPWEAWEKRR